jgi:hypothetical protein
MEAFAFFENRPVRMNKDEGPLTGQETTPSADESKLLMGK